MGESTFDHWSINSNFLDTQQKSKKQASIRQVLSIARNNIRQQQRIITRKKCGNYPSS